MKSSSFLRQAASDQLEAQCSETPVPRGSAGSAASGPQAPCSLSSDDGLKHANY